MLVDCAASMPAAGRAVGPARARRLLQLPDTCQQKEKTMIRLLMLAIASVVLLNACNTMSGIGKDIEAGGNKLENAADKNKQ